MAMRGIAAAALAALFTSAAVFAQGDAAKIDWTPCKKEIEEFQCKGTDEQIWTCLEQHDEKLSKACQEPHAQGDKAFKKAK